MPSRGSYQITNVQEGKAAERDQSFRSCILTLLIFLFLCVFLILITLPWSTYYRYHSEEQSDRARAAEQQHHHHHHQSYDEEYLTERTTSTTKSAVVSNTTATSTTTMLTFEAQTEIESITNLNNDSFEFNKIMNAESTTEDVSITSDMNERITYDYSTTTTTNEYSEISNTLLSTTEEYEKKNIDDGSNYTTETSYTESNWITEHVDFDTYENATDTEIEFTTESQENVTTVSIATTSQNAITRLTTSSTTSDSVTSDPAITTSSLPNYENVCTTGECKNMASKMLFYMNHNADPCEDFYEYACGNFESSPLTKERSLEDVSYQRISHQMEEERHAGKSSLFTKYYDSCMQYENIDLTNRIKLAKEELNKVSKFYTINDWFKNQTSFTELLARLLLHNSAILFDVTPDLDEYSPKQFTLRIGPTTYDNPFETAQTNDPCYASEPEMMQKYVDLRQLYTEYKICKKDTQKFIKSISEAMSALAAFNELNSSFIAQHINITCINIDLEIVQGFFANFPPRNEIREAYLMKNYTRVTIEQLEKKFKVVNWTQLIHLLTKELVKPEIMVQVYFYEALAKGLENLYHFGNRDPMLLHNAMLGLYARNLYQDLVLSKHRNAKNHCLRVAANLLIPEASNLYISSFSKDQLAYMDNIIHRLFEELKVTLKLKVENVGWTTQDERNALILKINSLRVAVPNISYFMDSKSTYRKNQTNEVNLTNNYFENSITLMQRYRKLIYAELYTNPGDPEQIWTHYATPYQPKGLAIYGLNLVVIPFGVVDWTMRYNDPPFHYITMATLGNVIAHEIAHHFDANGIYYWNGTRDDSTSLLNDNDSTNMNFKEYIDNQRDVLSHSRMSMMLPATGQNVVYEISQLTLNERLSETMGLRLAYDTLDRLRSSEEAFLPWFQQDFDQLFYLIYAQMYCTKSPLMTSYISLYENEELPSRIRIFISAFNNRLLGEAWNCPEGSQIMPSYTCSPFPYLQCNEVTQVTMMRK